MSQALGQCRHHCSAPRARCAAGLRAQCLNPRPEHGGARAPGACPAVLGALLPPQWAGLHTAPA